MKRRTYRGVSYKGSSINNLFKQQAQLEVIVTAEGGKWDGGGMAIGGLIRDAYFSATDKQLLAIYDKAIKAKIKILDNRDELLIN